jgi:hypothetical protein
LRPSKVSRGRALARAFLAETFFDFALWGAAFLKEIFFFFCLAITQKAPQQSGAGKNGGLIKNNSRGAQGEIWTNFQPVSSVF